MRIMLRATVVLYLGLVANITWANCDFETHTFREELSDPSQIEHIAVEIAKSRKWYTNSIAILSSGRRNIDDRYKDNLDATLIVQYPFGECVYSARVRQSGDWRDHIKLVEGGNVISSLDVKLYEGNILNAVRFKLLLPETRNGLQEVLGTLLVRNLGYIAPETFMVSADINGVSDTFLFQENAEKELLERNLRREGPIFEGDESVLWNVDGFSPFELEDVALARLSNDKWAEKGDTSLRLALNAFTVLQSAYLTYANDVPSHYFKFGTKIVPNRTGERTDFESYGLLMIAMNGSHSLRPHNRKYYFNSFIQDFEPIYYDGNFNFLRAGTSGIWDRIHGVRDYFLNHADRRIMDSLEEQLTELQNDETFKAAFLIRAGDQQQAAAALFSAGLPTILANFNALQSEIRNLGPAPASEDLQDLHGLRVAFVDRAVEHGIGMDVLVLDAPSADSAFTGHMTSASNGVAQVTLSSDELIKIMADNHYDDTRTLLLPTSGALNSSKFTTEPFLGGEIVSSNGATATVDTQARTLVVTQTAPTDWVLVRGATIQDWTITLIGGGQDAAQLSEQRFNEFGLTGCLNFYDVTFVDVRLQGRDGQCEDIINLVSSRGTLAKLMVENGFADAIDIDFSQVIIDELVVLRTGNDCFDVSTGTFTITRAQLSGCSDKGISVGENSVLVAQDVAIDGAAIGVSSKDFSDARITQLTGTNVDVCVEAFQKKQEYGGGTLVIDDFVCTGDINRDTASSITLNGDLQ